MLNEFKKMPWQGKVLVGTGVFLAIKEITKVKPPPANQAAIHAVADSNYYAQQGIQLSYPIAQYDTAADILETAFGGEWDGTNEAQVRAVFMQANNIRDVLQLIISFGVRVYPVVFGYGWSSGTLPQWITFEMTSSEIDYNINEVLAIKGINFTF